MDIDYKKLLKGQYEPETVSKDISLNDHVPDFSYNILNSLSPLYQPVIDQYYIQNGGIKPVWPNQKSFVVCLTHDVDHVSLNSVPQWIRIKKYQLSKRKDISGLLKNAIRFCAEFIINSNQFIMQESVHCYEKWLEKEDKILAKSTFFFSPGWSNITTHHESDCAYNLDDRIVFGGYKCSVLEMIKEIDRRGWEIGLHPSYSSYNDSNELKRQKEKFEKATDIEVFSVRQHHLYYDINITPSVHSQAGFKYDTTLGFNDNVGFRFGTCYPWYLTDLKCDSKLPTLEIPLIIQDGAMLKSHKGMRLNAHMAFRYIIEITEKVQKVGGVLTLLWHPSAIQNKNSWNLYLKILEFLKQKEPWFATISQVGDWWKLNNQKLSKWGSGIFQVESNYKSDA